ncbi:MAG: flagellar export chaperone FliS [Proteobacteria bacterium]|nr:flagellar export chaperone FliS [Pseudomonadota bacterium]
MAQGRPYQAYRNTQIQTSNQKQLIVMMFDGMNRFLNKAAKGIEENDIETAHANLHRTGQILLELLSTLREDKGGEIAGNLKKIYVFCYERIVIANLKKDLTIVRDVQTVLSNLGAGWKEIGRQDVGRSPRSAIPQQIRITG